MAGKDGLSIGYRMWWNIKRFTMTIFGPAQLGEDDPMARLHAERKRKVAEAQAKRAGR